MEQRPYKKFIIDDKYYAVGREASKRDRFCFRYALEVSYPIERDGNWKMGKCSIAVPENTKEWWEKGIAAMEQRFSSYDAFTSIVSSYKNQKEAFLDFFKPKIVEVDNSFAVKGIYSMIQCPHCRGISKEVEHYKIFPHMQTFADRMKEMYGELWWIPIGALAKKNYFTRVHFDMPHILVPDVFDTREAHCPICGKETSALFRPQTSTQEVKWVGDASSPYQNNHVFSTTVYDNGDDIAVSNHFKVLWFSKHASKAIYPDMYCRYVFNTKNGQTYLCPPKTANNLHVKGMSQKIRTVTFSGGGHCNGYLMHSTLQNPDIAKHVTGILLEKHGCSETRKKEWADFFEKTRYNDNPVQVEWEKMIFLLNRCPALSPDLCLSIVSQLNDKDHGTKWLLKGLKPDFTNREIMNCFIQKTGLPDCKTIRRLISQDITNVPKIALFKKCGFRDINSLSVFCTLPTDILYEERNAKLFFRSLISIRGEGSVRRLISKQKEALPQTWDIVRDTMKMHNRIRYSHPDLWGEDLVKGRTFKAIHDVLMLESAKVKRENALIPYSKAELKRLNADIDGYSFKTPEDTYTMVRAGAIMKICVGSDDYQEDALSKKHTIVLGYNSKGKPVMSLQIIRNKLVQARAECNDFIYEDAARALKKWVKIARIKPGTSDYNHIDKGEFDRPADVKENAHNPEAPPAPGGAIENVHDVIADMANRFMGIEEDQIDFEPPF